MRGIRIPVAAALLAAALGAGCETGDQEPRGAAPTPRFDAGAPPPPTPLGRIIARYDEGALPRDGLLAELAGLEAAPELPAVVDRPLLLRARPQPYAVGADVTVTPRGVLVLEPGVDLVLGKGVVLEISGRLLALGAAGTPVKLRGASREARFGTILLMGGPSEIVGAQLEWGASLVTVRETDETPIRIEGSRLDNWSSSAVELEEADGLVLLRNEIGVATRPEEARSEAIHGRQSAVRIEGNVFGRRAGYSDVIDIQPCTSGHHPVVVGNRFLGGDDDAIDLDTCDAIIVGNHLTGFRPGATAADEANGGGITGSGRSRPLVANNVLVGLVHGIGFKDGARPLVVNNTFVGCDIGLALYSAGAAEAATAVVINNVFANNKRDVVLDGSWHPAYNRDKRGALEGSHNLVDLPGFVGKDENRTEDPRVELRDGVPHLGAGSPAAGSGLVDLAAIARHGIFPVQVVAEALGKDFLGRARPTAGGRFSAMDRGAVAAPQ
jgi:hypothetical protein